MSCSKSGEKIKHSAENWTCYASSTSALGKQVFSGLKYVRKLVNYNFAPVVLLGLQQVFLHRMQTQQQMVWSVHPQHSRSPWEFYHPWPPHMSWLYQGQSHKLPLVLQSYINNRQNVEKTLITLCIFLRWKHV